MRIVGLSLLVLLVFLALVAPRQPAVARPPRPSSDGATAARRDGAELIGRPAPPWQVSAWLQSPPLTLAGLKGKVVLVRWFMSTACPLCSASAPTLNQLHADYADRGLVVIGMYHHKDPEPLDPQRVAGWVHDYGFQFPVAIDRDWKTLHRWWLDGGQRDFTSVTFLIDQAGVIRRIHPGGALVRGSKDDREMRAAIEAMLAPAR